VLQRIRDEFTGDEAERRDLAGRNEAWLRVDADAAAAFVSSVGLAHLLAQGLQLRTGIEAVNESGDLEMELLMDADQTADALPSIVETLSCGRVGDLSRLHGEEARDHLQAVLGPVLELVQSCILLGNQPMPVRLAARRSGALLLAIA
jgi:hypothetical protein